MKVDYLYKFGGVSDAAMKHLKYPSMPTLLLTIQGDITETNLELTVEEADRLARELTEYTEEIKRYAEALKEMEQVQA
ncbi:hypothetical protein ACI2LM_13290 [Paenibacillus lautus]|uniref:hypothetical protein n=1 Tax=Paenibacillus lautus TaxID=1401 RepID=UPI00384F8B26